MRGASLLSGSTPYSVADLRQEVDTSSIPLAEVSPCATKRTCSAWLTGISIDGDGLAILSEIADGKCCYFVGLRLLRSGGCGVDRCSLDTNGNIVSWMHDVGAAARSEGARLNLYRALKTA